MGLQQRLRSDVLRHLVTGTPIGTVMLVAFVLGWSEGGADSFELNAMSTAVVLAAFGLYGPVYLALSRFAWRGLRGRQLRTSLHTSQSSPGPLVRSLLVGGPTYWAVTAATMSLLAVAALAVLEQLSADPLLVVASLLCVGGSWILMVAAFSVEYAREWAATEGLQFPDEDPAQRTFGDFIYTAVQVSTTYSTSDVVTLNQRARRLVTVNSITAFLFSTVIIALVVALVLTGVR